MKNKRFLVVEIVVLFALVWLLFKAETDNKKSPMPASPVKENVKEKIEHNKKPKEKKTSDQEQAVIPEYQVKEGAIDFDALSFMALYRMYRQALLCERYIISWRRAKYEKKAFDYVDHIWEKEQENLVRQGYGAMDLSLPEPKAAMATAYANQCESLIEKWQATAAQDTYVSYMDVSLLNMLLIKKTASKKEKQLKALLKIQQQLPDLTTKVVESMQGKDTWTEQQIQEAKQRVKQLFSTVITIGALDDEAVIAHNKPIYAQIAEINQQLKEQKFKGVSLAQAAINDLEAVLMAAEKQIFSHDPDVYLLAKFILELTPGFSVMYGFSHKNLAEYFYLLDEQNSYTYQYQTPSSKFMHAVNLTSGNKFAYFITMVAVNELYYCGLGADCGPESPIMISKCLGLYGAGKNDACGLSVMDYYFNGHLTAGQLFDVDWMLVAMEQFYAP
ncbi:hypothetical protein [Marinicella rhabdoformis]|uniref:hypothetical protein n=1 Tax=Marinicella rhabdoformis TaxID=2580566 RepID=UPI0012AEB237|nr:hypothetical protein [Marinicella rhabdoformis]